ncbi:hydroxyacid dehydrogenase [Ottowia caeni]|uniref:hydroxyacid dehydrogenase n=1 Tax=Ottowia caeni TaxID=2870339 RepID=UPI003D74D9A1
MTAPRLAPEGLDLLRSAGARAIFLSDAEDVAEVEAIMSREPVDAVISRTVELSARAINACPTLKVISKHGVGVGNIDVHAATARAIPVYTTPGANAASVAELTIALMLAATRKVGWMDRELRAGRWSRAQDGLELRGLNLGLVGFGQVGRRVARIATALEMSVHVFDPAAQRESERFEGVVFHSSLDSMIPISHVLSLHVPLNQATRNLIDRQRIRLLPSGAVVVNTARGEVLDEVALIEALKDGQLHAAGLDTMVSEPLPAGHELSSLGNVVLTPHVGGSTSAALSAMALGAVRNVLGWLDGAPPPSESCVNPSVLSLISPQASIG